MNIIDSFYSKYKDGIHNLYYEYNSIDDELLVKEEFYKISPKLEEAISLFKDKFDNDDLNSYLLYVTNDCFKKPVSVKKVYVTYICPACESKGVVSRLTGDKYLQCNTCSKNLLKTKGAEFLLAKTFSYHSKNGYRCKLCQRFLPDANNIVCPYLDCSFSGSAHQLKKMHHPQIKEEIIEKANISPSVSNIKQIIEDKRMCVAYRSINATLNHKLAIYDAFLFLLDQFPEDMTQYLSGSDKYLGFQHKIFQVYVKLIERAIPFSFSKNRKTYKITSLLDPNLNLFKGIATFNSVVNDNLVIKNNTSEYYIGSRGGSIARPYYIGKVLEIFDESNNSLMENIKEYSFNLIKLQGVEPGVKVRVTHLMVVPHYEMGAMAIINKIRREIVNDIRR